MSLDQPVVEVAEITKDRDKLVTTTTTQRPDLGGEHNISAALAEDAIKQLTIAARSHPGRVFLLSWKGNKVPRGAKILNHTVAWTQNGQVTNHKGEYIGTYDRTAEFGGDDGKDQGMIVYLNPDAGAQKIEVIR